MDLNELMKLLKVKLIVPEYISKGQVISAFKTANADHSKSSSKDTNQHEMDFEEFMDCMQIIHREYTSMAEHLDDAVCLCLRAWGGRRATQNRDIMHLTLISTDIDAYQFNVE
jgi:hypothetical protein